MLGAHSLGGDAVGRFGCARARYTCIGDFLRRREYMRDRLAIGLPEAQKLMQLCFQRT